MKRAPLLMVAGALAGFAGVLGWHSRQAPAVPGAAATPPGGASASSPAANAVPAGPVAGRTALGPDEQYGYGVLNVQVTVSGTRITDISVPLLQTAEPTSQQISEEAIAMLRTEALSAQSARIDAISGATYTSEAYALSLQAAIDKLRGK